jgi:hypothetical protein
VRQSHRRRGLLRAVILIAVGIGVLVSRVDGGRSFDLGRVWERLVGRASVGSVERLFAEERSNVVVELEGRVSRVLADDLQGSRHQRFIVELGSGHTVLVSHNIDLAPRVPLSRGDSVELRGEYEWNDRGGVVHWTHRDPRGRRTGGWIRHQGEEYR